MNEIVIDLGSRHVNCYPLRAIQGDNKCHNYLIKIVRNKHEENLTGKQIVLSYSREGLGDILPLIASNTEKGEIEFELGGILTQVKGLIDFQLTIFNGDGYTESSIQFSAMIESNIAEEISGEIIKDSSFIILKDSLIKVEEYNKELQNATNGLEFKYANRLNEVDLKLSENIQKTEEYADTLNEVDLKLSENIQKTEEYADTLNEVSSQLSDIETEKANKNEVNNELNNKRDKNVKISNNDLDISDNSKKIQLLNLADEVISAMSGHTPVRPTLAEKEVTRDKIADYANDRLQVSDEVLSMYPFQKRASLMHNKTNNESIEILKKAIKRIELYNADEKRKYFLNYINRSNDGNNILTINIKNDLDIIVANIDKWNYDFQAGVNKVELNEQNNSGIKCYLYIDWSIFTAGKGYFNMEYDETGIAQECLYSFKEPIEKTEWLRISLPSKIYGVVGQELNIYFDNIILCNNLSNYQVNVECEKGIQQNERWTYIPESTGDFNLTIEVFKDGKSLIERKTVLISIKDKTGTGMKKALFIGDSLTDYNQYIQEIVNLFEKDSCNIKLLGTKGWNEQARHEGRSGWDTDDYANNPSYNGVVNPFWDPSSLKFDFNYYLTNNNIETPDIVVFMLGTNDVGRNVPTDKTIENLKKMIDNIKITKNDIKFGIALTPPPGASQDGFGKFNQCWATMFQTKQGNFELVERYIAEFDNKIGNISVIPVNVNLDTVNNFEYEEVKANSRSTVTIKRMNNNVHPAQSGMEQFADSYYGWLKTFY